VLARAPGADETVLRAFEAFDLRVFERRPIGALLAEAPDITLHDLFERQALDVGVPFVPRNCHVTSPG